MGRRIDELLVEIRHRREARAARLQGLIEAPVDFDRTEEGLALYRLIRELREISSKQHMFERILNVERLTRARANFPEKGTLKTMTPDLMASRVQDNLDRVTQYAKGRFANAKYVASIRSAIPDATIYAFIFELVEHAFDLLDEWDKTRPVAPRRIKSINARMAPKSLPPVSKATVEKAPASTTKSTIQIQPAILDHYVGSYRVSANVVLGITRKGKQLIGQMSGAEPVPLYARNRSEFFTKIAKFKFEVTDRGPAKWLVLHRDEEDHLLMRIDVPASQDGDDRSTLIGERKASKRETEAALRRVLDRIASGKLNYRPMSPMLAEFTREHLPGYQSDQQQLGAVQSMRFVHVDELDADVYAVTYERGVMNWRILMNEQKTIHMLSSVFGTMHLSAPGAPAG